MDASQSRRQGVVTSPEEGPSDCLSVPVESTISVVHNASENITEQKFTKEETSAFSADMTLILLLTSYMTLLFYYIRMCNEFSSLLHLHYVWVASFMVLSKG